MSKSSITRWTSEATSARVRRRYAAERRFRLIGLSAVALSAAFLAFLLFNMAWKGLGGFTQVEAALPINFPASDLILDPAALRGPQAEEVVANAGLEGVLSQAASAVYGEAAGEMFGAASARSLGRQLIDDAGLLQRQATLWLPVGSNVESAAKGEGDPPSEKLVETLRA